MAFATKHQKELLVQDSFKNVLGIDLVVAELDTDQFGTFSGEIERKLSPLDTAVAKARAGIEKTGLKLGLASEGTIGNDLQMPLVVSDLELMVLVDTERNLIISELFRSFEIVSANLEVTLDTDLTDYLSKINFPSQRIIAKRHPLTDEKDVIKGIANLAELNSAIAKLANQNRNQRLILEPDYRAHNCPTRKSNISRVGERLLQRILNLCQKCQTPGFGKVNYLRGLHCASCKTFNPDAIASEYLGCVACDYQTPGKTIRTELDSANCDICNP